MLLVALAIMPKCVAVVVYRLPMYECSLGSAVPPQNRCPETVIDRRFFPQIEGRDELLVHEAPLARVVDVPAPPVRHSDISYFGCEAIPNTLYRRVPKEVPIGRQLLCLYQDRRLLLTVLEEGVVYLTPSDRVLALHLR